MMLSESETEDVSLSRQSPLTAVHLALSLFVNKFLWNTVMTICLHNVYVRVHSVKIHKSKVATAVNFVAT